MGTNCSRKPDPDTSNQCNVSVGDRVPERMPGFCSLRGVGGDSHRSEYCRLMSSGGEWGDPETSGNCEYNDCNSVQDFGSGCCRGCCGIAGGGLKCKRLSFTGNPVQCCFNDLACNNTDAACFSDPDRQNTCADGQNGQPNYRSIISTDCEDILFRYCTGTMPADDPNSAAWIDRWTSGQCTEALYRNIFATGGPNHCFTPPTPIPGVCNVAPPFPFDAQRFYWGTRLVNGALERYQELGFEIGTLPGLPGYNPFQDYLYSNVCCPYPGLCQEALRSTCADKTAQRISFNPTLTQWCGCHLPSGEYQDYSVRYNIPAQCAPTCNRAGTIPITGLDGLPVRCEQNICLIDNVTVNLISSQVGGGVNFDQVCGNCSGSQCSCIVTNTTIDVNNSTIGGNFVPVAEGCGTLTCTQSNAGSTGPATITVPCGTTGNYNPYAHYEAEVAAADAEAARNSWFTTIIIVGVALLLIFLILLIVPR